MILQKWVPMLAKVCPQKTDDPMATASEQAPEVPFRSKALEVRVTSQ